jgi:carbon monoxide dehydrogenase subunit G
MISIREEVTIPSPPRRVWPILRDPALVASCIPGATLTAADEGGAYQGTMRVKFGPTSAIFRGEAKLAYDDDARRCTIEGRGIDGRGASRALASGIVTASGRAATLLRVEGSFNVTGPLETFANAGGVHLARAILADFAQNMARLVEERAPSEAEEPDETEESDATAAESPGMAAAGRPAPAAAAPLHGGRLLWRAFLGWLKQLIFAKGKTE